MTSFRPIYSELRARPKTSFLRNKAILLLPTSIDVRGSKSYCMCRQATMPTGGRLSVAANGSRGDRCMRVDWISDRIQPSPATDARECGEAELQLTASANCPSGSDISEF
jgi:hypothetical protein